MDKKQAWYTSWFNEDYLNLYYYRNIDEAKYQVDFVEKALELTGQEKILDLGCGMGRHSLVFAERGYSVVGIDLSPYLIKKAKEMIQPDMSLQFIHGDIRKLANLGAFDVILSMFTSFGYEESDEKNRQFISVVKQHLNENGQFFLDYLHPYKAVHSLVPFESKQVKGETVEIRRYIEGNMIVKEIHFPGRSYLERIKLYTRGEIEDTLQSNGFHVLSVWNDYQGNPWHDKGDRQLFRAKLA